MKHQTATTPPQISVARPQRNLAIRSSTRLPRRHAFTLVEILVVLAIIGVLAAILFPVLGSARETARTATCSGNLKQIYLGTQMYMRDSNGIYPNVGVGGDYKCGWASLIYPYVKSTAVFECPNAEHGEFKLGCPLDSEDGQDKWDGSYQINALRVGRRQQINESLVSNASQVCLFVDGNGGGSFTPYDGLYDSWVEGFQVSADSERGHHGGLNIGFADGHVKWVGADAMANRALWLNGRDEEFRASATPTPRP